MSPVKFEADYAAVWRALEAALDHADGQTGTKKSALAAALGTETVLQGAAFAEHYRRCCEHLALAQARGYPIHLTQRLEQLTQRAHQQIYRQQDYGLARLGRFFLVTFPQAVRAHRWYLLVSALLFLVPLGLLAWASYRDPGFILHLLDANEVRNFEHMYGKDAESIGRLRSADSDWQMFGHYIQHNISIGFQCFASGIFAGLGSVFYLLFNGVFAGTVAGFLVATGHATNLLSFVVTHSAFELTAVVLAGAAGLRLGHAVVAPQGLGRMQALQRSAHTAIPVVYGVVGMLLIAAAIEAFWSSAVWVAPPVKYGVGAVCWALVLAYLAWQGRAQRAPAAGGEPQA